MELLQFSSSSVIVIENIQNPNKNTDFLSDIIDVKKTSWYFIFAKKNLKANLLKSRDAKPDGAKVKKFDHVSRLLPFLYMEKV